MLLDSAHDEGQGGRGGKGGEGEKKRRKRGSEFHGAASSSSVAVAMRILLDIPRLVRMRSSECRTRKPCRMASRVWVVRIEEEGMDDRGSETERAVKGPDWEIRTGRNEWGGGAPWKIYPRLPQLCR